LYEQSRDRMDDPHPIGAGEGQSDLTGTLGHCDG
jgi:hypothetical protein